jgi:ferredoxin--NADP+ reductase
MYRIVNTQVLAPTITRFEIEAPFVARKRKAGNFIMIRVDDHGERIPLTIADSDPAAGTITIIVQAIGKTTKLLCTKKAGDSVLDAGNIVLSIIGARSRDLVILEEDMRRFSDRVAVTTDDGSYGRKGFVTDQLKEFLDTIPGIGAVYAIGPLPMMKAVANLTRPYHVHTLVSLNTVMVDGTGMCGGCRVTVNGEMKFACVDGPEFDGHTVDFDELMMRNRTYNEMERISEEEHACRLAAITQESVR